MHYHCEIWFPTRAEIKSAIDKVMAPYCEEGSSKRAFWDWYVIGGRWAGEHDGYKPWEDSRNYSICNLCNGTGMRKDVTTKNMALGTRGCNGCYGTGIKQNYNNCSYEGNIMSLSEVRDDIESYTLIIARGRWPKIFHKTDYTGNVKSFLKENGIEDGFLVTVDYHC